MYEDFSSTLIDTAILPSGTFYVANKLYDAARQKTAIFVLILSPMHIVSFVEKWKKLQSRDARKEHYITVCTQHSNYMENWNVKV